MRFAALSSAFPVRRSKGKFAKVTSMATASKTTEIAKGAEKPLAHHDALMASTQINARLLPIDVMPAQRRTRW